jgi:hypothetical protein
MCSHDSKAAAIYTKKNIQIIVNFLTISVVAHLFILKEVSAESAILKAALKPKFADYINGC